MDNVATVVTLNNASPADPVLNSITLQERAFMSSIKSRLARPPAGRRASVLNATPRTQHDTSPTQRRVLSSIRFQRSAQYSTASRCKRESLGVSLKSRPARRLAARRLAARGGKILEGTPR